MASTLIKKTRRRFAVLLSLCVLSSASAGGLGPDIPRGKGDQCVADVDDMRRNHMDYIMHQRDETVVEGIRGKPFSLTDCVNCHAQTDANGQALRIDAPGQFCQSCHGFASVKIDCFSCHRATPDAPVSTAALKRMPDSHHGHLYAQTRNGRVANPLQAADFSALRHITIPPKQQHTNVGKLDGS